MGDPESRQEAQVQPVGYAIQWDYPGHWFDEMGSLVMTMGQNSQVGIDLATRNDLSRKDRRDLSRAIIDSGLTGYDA